MDASHQLLSMVNDLLEMTTLSTGRLLLAEAPFGLRREIEPLLAACAEEAARRELAFTADIDADVPEALVGDAARLRQILGNIMQNALKFTENGSVTVRVSRLAGKSGPDASTLVFSVRDTGIGIPPERQERIFERFTIGEDFLHKRYGKIGVGLAISKEIVEKMGGSMYLESTPGRGSLFSFTAVLRHAPASDRHQPPKEAAPDRGTVILCIPDDPVSRLLVARILENQGFSPVTTDSSQMFLETLRRMPADLALVDLQKPHRGTLDAIRRIRSGLEPGIEPGMPIVALTRHAAEAACHLATDLTGCVAKPVTRQELIHTVEQALSGRVRTILLKPQVI